MAATGEHSGEQAFPPPTATQPLTQPGQPAVPPAASAGPAASAQPPQPPAPAEPTRDAIVRATARSQGAALAPPALDAAARAADAYVARTAALRIRRSQFFLPVSAVAVVLVVFGAIAIVQSATDGAGGPGQQQTGHTPIDFLYLAALFVSTALVTDFRLPVGRLSSLP